MQGIMDLETVRQGRNPGSRDLENVPGVDFRRKAMEGRRSIILQLGCFKSSSCSRYLFNSHGSNRRARVPPVSQNEK